MKKSSQTRVLPAIPLALPKKNPGVRQTSSPTTPIISGGGSAKGRSEDGAQKTAVLAAPQAEAGPAATQVVAEDQSKGAGAERSVETPVSSDHSSVPPLSNGTTPDRQLNGVPSPATNGMPDNFSPATSSDSGRPRKPSERFDMRHIRTELPPAFVPSAEQHTPQSATSSQSRQQPPLAHPGHPSASHIVFGGIDSSGSSPAPPPNVASAFVPPQHPPQAPFHSHAHHASEPYPQRGHPPPFHQQSAPWGMRQGFAPVQSHNHHHNHPHGHMPPRYPPRESQSSGSATLRNGYVERSRSGSQSSGFAQDDRRDLQSPVGLDQSFDTGKAMFNDAKGFPPAPRPFPSHIPHPSQHFPHPDVAASFENAEAMRNYILSQFENPDLADCHLRVLEEGAKDGQHVYGHTFALARSSTLLELIRRSEPPTQASMKRQVDVLLPGRYVQAGAFREALRYIYGGALPQFEQYNLGPNAPIEDRMAQALQYIATGAWLNLPAFAHRGVEIASGLLQWDTITLVLDFTLMGGLSQAWSIDDGSEERTSTCSSDDSLTKPEAGGIPTYDPFATALLTRTLDFISHNFPPNFYLDSSAPQSAAFPRLPAQTPRHESRPSRSDPRLSKIRFGEHPVEDHSRPSFATTTLSTILLSLPFPLLRYLLEAPVLPARLGAETVASIMRQVVHEREIRRQKTLKAHASSQSVKDTEPHLVQNLYWVESVEESRDPLHRAGFRLARRRRGMDTPPATSGVESEQRN